MNFLLVIFFLSALCCLIGGVGGIFLLFKNSKNADSFALKFCTLGFALQTVSLCVLGVESGRLPTANSYELFEFFAWLILATYLIFRLILNVKFLGIFISASAGIFAGLPILCPYFSEKILFAKTISLNLAKAHAFLAMSSYAFLLICSIFSFMYLLQIRLLKSKSTGELTSGLLPLPRLERFSKNWLQASTFAMALSILFGFLSLFESENFSAHFVKISLGLILFFAMIFMLKFSNSQKCTPRKFAMLNILLFLSSILIFLAIQYKTYLL